jgi:hypothetical protein
MDRLVWLLAMNTPTYGAPKRPGRRACSTEHEVLYSSTQRRSSSTSI